MRRRWERYELFCETASAWGHDVIGSGMDRFSPAGEVPDLRRDGSGEERQQSRWRTAGAGWYETPLEWFQQPNNYGDTHPPALRAQLRIEHTDGSVERVTAGTDLSGAHVEHCERGALMTASGKTRGWTSRDGKSAGFKGRRMDTCGGDQACGGEDRGTRIIRRSALSSGWRRRR